MLIVDDNAQFRRLVRRFLENAVNDFYECENGAEAVYAFDKYLPDWVLMDVEMAEMDGLSATREILKAHPEARIVIITQHNDRQMQAAARAAGAFGFVAKENLSAVREVIASAA